MPPAVVTWTVTVPGACNYTFDAAVTQVFGPVLYVCPTATWKAPGGGTMPEA